MTTERPRDSWPCRPSLFTTRMVSLASGLFVALAGVFLFFRSMQILWLVAAVPVGIWAGFKGGPLLLRTLVRAGAFGRVRLEDGRLRLGRARAVRLAEAFEVDARLETAQIRRVYDLKDMGVTTTHARRTHTLRIRVLSVVIAQNDLRVQLTADETNRAPGPAYEVEGLAVRPLPVQRVAAPQIRLWGADLADVLRRLRAAEGYSTPAQGEQPPASGDPRTRFCPRWKVAVGAAAVLGAFAAGVLASYEGYQERSAAQSAAMHAEADRQKRGQEALGRSLLGRRVAVAGQAGRRLVGTVERYQVRSTTSYDPYRITWSADVFVRVRERIGADGRVLSDEVTVTYRSAEDVVRSGDEIEARAADLLEPQPTAPDPE